MKTTIGRWASPSAPPIGFLLRKLDRLIDERFERTLGDRGITRRQWQLIHTLAKGDATLDALTAAVAPFLDQSAGETAKQHLDPLAKDGLIGAQGDSYAITDAGRRFFESLLIEVQAIRELSVAGLAEGEYERTVGTLQAMIGNLEAEA